MLVKCSSTTEQATVLPSVLSFYPLSLEKAMFTMRPRPSHSFSPAHASAHPPSTSPTPLWEAADMLDWQVLTVQLDQTWEEDTPLNRGMGWGTKANHMVP